MFSVVMSNYIAVLVGSPFIIKANYLANLLNVHCQKNLQALLKYDLDMLLGIIKPLYRWGN